MFASLWGNVTMDSNDLGFGFDDPTIDLRFQITEFVIDRFEYFDLMHNALPALRKT